MKPNKEKKQEKLLYTKTTTCNKCGKYTDINVYQTYSKCLNCNYMFDVYNHEDEEPIAICTTYIEDLNDPYLSG